MRKFIPMPLAIKILDAKAEWTKNGSSSRQSLQGVWTKSRFLQEAPKETKKVYFATLLYIDGHLSPPGCRVGTEVPKNTEDESSSEVTLQWTTQVHIRSIHRTRYVFHDTGRGTRRTITVKTGGKTPKIVTIPERCTCDPYDDSRLP